MDELNINDLLPQDGSNTDSLQPPVDDGVELEVAPGRRERFTKDQLLTHYKERLMHSDYTKKTQEIAEQRKQWEQAAPQIQQLAREHAAMLQLLEDEKQIDEWKGKRFKKPEPPPEQFDPKMWEANETKVNTLHQQIAHLQQQLQYQPQQIIAQTRNEIETAQLSEHVNAHLGTLFSSNPVLGIVDNAEDILRFKVFQRQPKDINEAKAFFTEEAEKMTAKITGHFNVVPGTPSPTKAVVKAKGIEPPGGIGSPAPVPTSYKGKDGKVDMKKVHEMAESYLANMKTD